jgi:hypothetical protein
LFGVVYRVTAHGEIIGQGQEILTPKREGHSLGCPRLTWVARVVCVPHYLGQVAHGSLSSFVRWTTIRNVRLNADRSLRRDRLPSLPSVPMIGFSFRVGLVNASVRSDGVNCDGMLDALRRQVVQGQQFGVCVSQVEATGR